MNITDIYAKYKIPHGIQTHMITVAAVGTHIARNVKNKGRINEKKLTTALLLHDTGNILKIDFNNPEILLKMDPRPLDFWREVREEYLEKYGKDENEATLTIMKEVCDDQETIDIMNAMPTPPEGLGSIKHNLNMLIAGYSDERVAPYGVVSIQERYDEIEKRYAGRNHPLGNKEFLDRYRKRSRIVEGLIQEETVIDIETIHQQDIEPLMAEINNFVI